MKDAEYPQPESSQRKKSRFLCVIGHHAADAMFVHDMNGRFLDVNEQACHSLGYSRQELLTMEVADVDVAYVEKEHRRKLWSRLDTDKAVSLEGMHKRKDGSIFPVEVHLSLLHTEGQKNIIAVVRDISDRKEAEAVLQETRQKLEGILAAATDHISMIDAEHNIVWANKVAERLFGPDLMGSKCYYVYHGFEEPCRPCIVEKCFKSGQVHEHETEVVNRDGFRMVFWCTASVAALHKDGRPKLVVEVSRDITDRKMAEEKFLQYHDRLRKMGSQLSLAEEKERRRIADEVHDHIGQNLALAKIKLSALHTNDPSSHNAEAIEEIVRLIDSTISDTRSLVSEIGSPILYELGFEPAVHWLAQQAEKKYGIAVRFENDDHPKPLSDDMKVFLFQAVRELLANVGKHSRADHCTVSISVKKEKLRIDVEDNGVGFDVEEMDTPGTEGLGFGFFSIRERLNPLGGTLQVHSRPTEGARITICAPLMGE